MGTSTPTEHLLPSLAVQHLNVPTQVITTDPDIAVEAITLTGTIKTIVPSHRVP